MAFSVPMDSTAADTLASPAALSWFHVDETVSYIALALAAAILVIAYFAGGRENRTKLLFSIVLASLLSALITPLLLVLAQWLGITAASWGTIATLCVALILAAAIAAHTYEIVTVTAREARPPK